MKRIDIEVEDRNFEASLADNFLTHFMGMRFRSSGKMLFKFYRESQPGIDMLFVPKTLHLYFIDSNKEIVDVQKAEPWGLNPFSWRFYRPENDVKYLLESFEDLGIEEGQKLEF